MKTRGKTWLGRGAAAFILVAAAIGGPMAAGAADPAQTLFSEALTLTTKARNEPDAVKRADMLRRVIGNLDKIVAEHPNTKLAVLLRDGKPIGAFERKQVEQLLAETGVQTAPQTAPQPAEPPPVQQTSPQIAAAPDAAPEPPRPAHGRGLPIDADPTTPTGQMLSDIAVGIDSFLATRTVPFSPSVREPLRAVEQGDRIVVQLRGFQVEMGSARLEFGDIDVGVKRLAGDTGYVVDFKVPPEVAMFVSHTQKLMSFTIAEGSASGTWRKDLGFLTDGDLDLTGLRARAHKGDAIIDICRLDSLKGRQATKEADGTLSMTSLLEINSLLMTPPEPGDPRLSVKRVVIGSEGRGISVETVKRLQDFGGLQAIGAMQGEAHSALQFLDILAQAAWDGIKLHYAVDGFAFAKGAQTVLSAERLALDIGFDNKADMAAVEVGVDVQKVTTALQEVKQVPDELLPHSLTVSTRLDRLPAKTIAELGKSWFQGETGRTTAAAPLSAMQNAVFEAKPELGIKTLAVAAKQAQISTTGAIAINPIAKLMVSGGFDVQVVGLDLIKARLDKDGATQPQLAEMVPVVVGLRGLGEPSKLGDRNAHSYRVDINTDGGITINNTPWETLIPKKRP
ncbi:hypothetical protein FHW79_003173 [Azospirillum sp. OGB3]|uniref:hypothetical protein n=1 Tax=Azospirillum sp. OGB3 TaxID=2587012 RepID=UPI0016058D01|nr:hypothetical protein [Azospirillum sp. OGB3]MBB3265544.1 hypothetical protein [Azospirillum sp. OGB3]